MTLRKRAERLRDLIIEFYQRRTCPHSYRAALVNNKPGRVCRICDQAEELSAEDFYAHFGEKYQGLIRK